MVKQTVPTTRYDRTFLTFIAIYGVINSMVPMMAPAGITNSNEFNPLNPRSLIMMGVKAAAK